MPHASEVHRRGDRVPDFTLPTQKGDRRTLSEFLKKGPVLLAFHRGTW